MRATSDKGVRAITLADVEQWCATSGADPVTVVGELLAGHQLPDLAGLLAVTRAKGREDALELV